MDHLQQAIQYQAAKQRTIDALDVYSTDGRLILYNLKVLRDDRHFFPPYEAAALVRGETLKKHPEVGAILGLLAGSLSEDAMRAFNLRLQEGHESEVVVARDALRAIGLVVKPGAALEHRARKPGFLAYLWSARKDLGRLTLQHLGLSAAALLLGALVAIPLGLWLERHRRWAETVIRLLGLLQTVPSLALLAFMIPLLGRGGPPRHRGALDLLALPHREEHLLRRARRRSESRRGRDRPGDDPRPDPPRGPPPPRRPHRHGRPAHRRRDHGRHRHPRRLHRRWRPR